MPRALSRTHFQTHFRAHFRAHLEEGSQAHVTAVRSHAHTQRSALGKCQWVLRWQDSLLQFTDHYIKKSERCSKLIFPQQRGDSSLCLSRLKRLWRREIASRGEEKSSSHHEFFVPWNELFSSNL